MYRYSVTKANLEPIGILMKEPLTDAIMFNVDSSYYILSTYVPTPSGRCLTVWQSMELTEQYQKTQEIRFDENIARNAGMLFNYDGKLIRPAQECNNTYGHSISFQEVDICNGVFSFKEMFRWYSVHSEYSIGAHTYNQHSEGMAVIDVKGYRYPKMGRLLKYVDRVLEAISVKKPYKPV